MFLMTGAEPTVAIKAGGVYELNHVLFAQVSGNQMGEGHQKLLRYSILLFQVMKAGVTMCAVLQAV